MKVGERVARYWTSLMNTMALRALVTWVKSEDNLASLLTVRLGYSLLRPKVRSPKAAD